MRLLRHTDSARYQSWNAVLNLDWPEIEDFNEHCFWADRDYQIPFSQSDIAYVRRQCLGMNAFSLTSRIGHVQAKTAEEMGIAVASRDQLSVTIAGLLQEVEQFRTNHPDLKTAGEHGCWFERGHLYVPHTTDAEVKKQLQEEYGGIASSFQAVMADFATGWCHYPVEGKVTFQNKLEEAYESYKEALYGNDWDLEALIGRYNELRDRALRFRVDLRNASSEAAEGARVSLDVPDERMEAPAKAKLFTPHRLVPLLPHELLEMITTYRRLAIADGRDAVKRDDT